MSNATCLVCNTSIRGRADKRFCGDQCRSIHNNKIRQTKEEKRILTDNKILRRNRTILKSLCPAGEAIVEKKILESLGYKVGYFTSTYTTRDKTTYYICYDYAFTPVVRSGVRKALILLRQNFMRFQDPWRSMPRSMQDQTLH